MTTLVTGVVATDVVGAAPASRPVWWLRWLPFAVAVLAVSAILVRAHTSPLDILRYAAYATLAVALPGTLCYRAMRRVPHTFVEDVAMGLAVGLVLELVAWAVFGALHLQGWMFLWPLAVVLPFLCVRRLHRHWRADGYTDVPLGWSWTVAAIVVSWTVYLSTVFLRRNPVLPTSEGTRQYLDLAYQLSLAGNAKHHFPIQFPQVAGEPLYYHWFGYAHMASVSLIGHIDLPVVSLRLAVPGLCALAIVLTAVVGWRVSGRAWVGAGAAILFWVIGEVDFRNPVQQFWGTQATFVIWHGMSMIYGWVLLIAAIAPMADLAGRTPGSRVPVLGRGRYAILALFAFASGAAKASSLPVMLSALLFAAVILLVVRRSMPWPLIGGVALLGAAELFTIAVIFRFHTYGLSVDPLLDLRGAWAPVPGRPGWHQPLVVAAVVVVFAINMESRGTGILSLLALRRLRLDPVQTVLAGGAIAGIALFLTFGGGSQGEQYFTRSGFPFVVILSAWGWSMVVDRARPSRPFLTTLAVGAVAFCAMLTAIELEFAPPPGGTTLHQIENVLAWAGAFVVLGSVVAIFWVPAARRLPALRGRGAAVALTAALVFGAPGLVMDMYKSYENPNGGAYVNTPLPRTRIEAARWIRAHSDPDDILATNDHCLNESSPDETCDSRVFWLSAYSERNVLIEGWAFAPRVEAPHTFTVYWDMPLLQLNDSAFTDPTPATLHELHQTYRVRYLVVDRRTAKASPTLDSLATKVYDNGSDAVYALS